MKPVIFHVEAAGEFRPVEFAFATESEVRRVRAWRKMTPASDAGEFAALAAKRWFYYTREGATVARHFTRRCCESVPCRTHSSFGNGRCARFANATWPKSKGGLPDPSFRCTIADMKAQRKRDWLDECFEYEATHPIAFASPRALMEARLIAEMDKARLPHRRNHRNGVARRRKAVPG